MSTTKLPRAGKASKAAPAPKARKARAPKAAAAPAVAPAEPEATTAPDVIDANATYADIRAAFDHFNAALFAGELPVPLLTLRGVRGSRGHFAPDRYTPHGAAGGTVPEIALNPETFAGRTTAEILSTLVHEMAHLWDECYGAPGQNNYHSKSWGQRMLACGLQPVDHHGADKVAGQSLTHYIPDDERGDVFRAALEALPSEVRLWADAYSTDCPSYGMPVPPAVTARRAAKAKRATAQKASKTKFVCPHCRQAAWAKPTARLICGNLEGHADPSHIHNMEPEAAA